MEVIMDSRFVNEGQTNSIFTTMIQNDAITSAKIASNSVRLNELNTGSVDGRYVNREGDSMTGILNMNNNRITNVPNPVEAGDALSLSYADSRYSQIPPLCNEDNQALGWDGSNWVCNTIESSGGGDGVYSRDELLVNEVHTVGECLDLNGQINVDDGDLFCRFDLHNCPSEWTRFNNWGTYLPRNCNGCLPCSTSGNVWRNAPAPTCTYRSESGDGNCQRTYTCTANSRSQIGCY
ncbi:MAG: hypothetical protein LAT82_01470 [Nanoarchaeota archaeon]|nr:hypothetical protein [Nanoarchaeota archaeon]